MSRLHRDVMAQVTLAVVSGRLPPGSLLPREVDLAQEYGVSRGTARETIRAMEERGLVSVRHGRGAVVTDPSNWDLLDPDVLRAMLAGPGGPEVLDQYLRTRMMIEVEVVALAAQLADAADLERMRAQLAAMEEVGVLSEQGDPLAERRFHEADLAFHQCIFAAARNQVLAGLIRRVHEALFIARVALARPQFRTERALPEHRAIFEAVSAGDPAGARRAMTAHLRTVEHYLLEQADRPATGAAAGSAAEARQST